MVTMRQRRRLSLTPGVPRAQHVELEVSGERRPEHTERPERVAVDFNDVSPEHAEIDERLRNWAKWCSNRGTPAVAPGFGLYRSSNAKREYGAATVVPTDKHDAARIAAGVAALPVPERLAIQWSYRDGRDPRRAAAGQGTTPQGLAERVVRGRQMLINRGV